MASVALIDLKWIHDEALDSWQGVTGNIHYKQQTDQHKLFSYYIIIQYKEESTNADYLYDKAKYGTITFIVGCITETDFEGWAALLEQSAFTVNTMALPLSK